MTFAPARPTITSSRNFWEARPQSELANAVTTSLGTPLRARSQATSPLRSLCFAEAACVLQDTLFGSARSKRKEWTSFIRGQEAQGKRLKLTPQTIEGIDIGKLEFKLNIGMEVRRLAIKLAIAAAEHMGFSDGLIDKETREFLLGNTKNTTRVRLHLARHEALEKIRPPLSHFAFVKGNSQTHKSYAIVQFYGLVQLYVLLNDGAFARNDFAIIAVFDLAKGYAERFEQTELLAFPEAPIKLGHSEAQRLQLDWMKKWNAEAQAVLQDDAQIISSDLSDRV